MHQHIKLMTNAEAKKQYCIHVRANGFPMS